jgi:hypothetical protein
VEGSIRPSFSEEKEAKRLHLFDAEKPVPPHQTNESFLVLFFKKEPLPSIRRTAPA